MYIKAFFASIKEWAYLCELLIGVFGLIALLLYCCFQPYLRIKGIITANKKRTRIGNIGAFVTLLLLIGFSVVKPV